MNPAKLKTEIKEHVNQHLAIISVFFNGSAEEYVRHWHKQIKGLKHLIKVGDKDTTILDKYQKMHTIEGRISFIIKFIPPKIKWNYTERNS